MLAIGLPAGWYVASPLWIRTVLVEPEPVAGAQPTRRRPRPPAHAVIPAPPPLPRRTAPPASPPPAAFAPRRVAVGLVPRDRRLPLRSRHRGHRRDRTGALSLRLDDFSVRNGPDLFVYLSPAADDYADGALELGRLKATDGAFGYDLPPGTDPAAFASAIIWCKQFSHLFAVAELAAT